MIVCVRMYFALSKFYFFNHFLVVKLTFITFGHYFHETYHNLKEFWQIIEWKATCRLQRTFSKVYNNFHVWHKCVPSPCLKPLTDSFGNICGDDIFLPFFKNIQIFLAYLYYTICRVQLSMKCVPTCTTVQYCLTYISSIFNLD